MLHLVETTRRLTWRSSEGTFIERPLDDPSIRQPEITLAKTDLGWEPVIEFEAGLQRIDDYFRLHPELVQV